MAWRLPDRHTNVSQPVNNQPNNPKRPGFNPAVNTTNSRSQSVNQSINQSINQSVNQNAAPSGSRPLSTSHVRHSNNQLNPQAFQSSPFRSFSQSLHSAPNRLHNQSFNQSNGQSYNETINQSIDQSTNHPTNLQLSPEWNPSMSPLLSPQSPISPMPSTIHRTVNQSINRSVSRNSNHQKRAFNFTPSHKSILNQPISEFTFPPDQSFKQSPLPHMSYSVHNGQMNQFDLDDQSINQSANQPLLNQSKNHSFHRTKKLQRHRVRNALKICCCCGLFIDRLVDRMLTKFSSSINQSVKQSINPFGRRNHLLPHSSQVSKRVMPATVCLVICLFGSLITLLIVLYSLLLNQSINQPVDQSPNSVSKYAIPASLPTWLQSVNQDPHAPFTIPARSRRSLTQPINRPINPSMLIFTIMRDFSPEFSESNSAEYHSYEMAMTSWLQAINQSVNHFSKVLVAIFVDHADSCPFIESFSVDQPLHQSINKTSSQSINQPIIRCHVITALHSEYKRPYLDRIWKQVKSTYQSINQSFDYYTFVNGDILLFPDFFQSVNFVHQSVDQSMIVARRRDASFVPLSKSSFSISQSANQPTNRLISTHSAFARGSMHDSFGIDVFVMRSSLFDWLTDRFPPFLVGVYRWDNWLLASVLKVSSISDQSINQSDNQSVNPSINPSLFGPVIDATNSMVIGHSDIVSDHLNSRARTWNDDLCKRLIDHNYRLGSIENADWKVVVSQSVSQTSSQPNSQSISQSNSQSISVKLNIDADLSILRSTYQFQINHSPRLPLMLWRHAYQSASQPSSQPVNQPAYTAIAFVPVYSFHADQSVVSVETQAVNQLSRWLCQSESLSFTEQIVVTNSVSAYWTMFMSGMQNMIYVGHPVTQLINQPGSQSINQTSILPVVLVGLVKSAIEHGVHSLLVDASALLLDHPLMTIDQSCDSISSSPLSSRHLLLTSMPRSDHTWNLVKKVEQCLVLDFDDRLIDKSINDIDRAHDRLFHECLSDVTRSAFMPLPSFTSCVNDRVQLIEHQSITRFVRQSTGQSTDQSINQPFPLAIVDRSTIDRASVSPLYSTLQRALCLSCSPLPPLPYRSINPSINQSINQSTTPVRMIIHVHVRATANERSPLPPLPYRSINPSINQSINQSTTPVRMIIHVHVRATANEREIRLFLRSLLFADYDSRFTDLTVVFDVHALPHSNPPQPTELATRFEAILDEFDADFPPYIKLMPTYSHLSSKHDMYTSFLTFDHAGEEYVAVWGSESDWHLFVDSGLAFLPQWHRWCLLAFTQHWNERTFAISILPVTNSAHIWWKGYRADSQRSLVGLLVSGEAAHFFAHYQQKSRDQCKNTVSTLQSLLNQYGMHILHTANLEVKTMNEAEKHGQQKQLVKLNLRDDIIQQETTIYKQGIWWQIIRGETCEFE